MRASKIADPRKIDLSDRVRQITIERERFEQAWENLGRAIVSLHEARQEREKNMSLRVQEKVEGDKVYLDDLFSESICNKEPKKRWIQRAKENIQSFLMGCEL